MARDDLSGFGAMLRGFVQHRRAETREERIARHLVVLEIHDLWNFVTEHPEKLAREAA